MKYFKILKKTFQNEKQILKETRTKNKVTTEGELEENFLNFKKNLSILSSFFFLFIFFEL